MNTSHHESSIPSGVEPVEHIKAHQPKRQETQRRVVPRWVAIGLPLVLTLTVSVGMMLVSNFSSMNASSTPTVVPAKKPDSCLTPNEKFFAPVIKSMLEQGAESSFVKLLMNDPRTAFNESLVRINVVGQRKKADYSHNYTPQAAEIVREFIDTNDSTLTAAEKVYGVPKEVISALLFVETKHGQVTGLHHVASVYLSVAMSTQPEYIEKNKVAMREKFEGAEDEAQDLEGKIEQRAAKKAAWAVKELVALNKMQVISPMPVLALYGSYAGAFGWAQFLPSSYVRCAVDGNADGKINLFDMPDAVCSVANYLKLANWSGEQSAQRRAIFAYNNSEDYVSAILALARRASDRPSSIASSKNAKSVKATKASKKSKKSIAKKSSSSSKRSKSSSRR
jgi:membrane-bound lytic murein transglycosylase B